MDPTAAGGRSIGGGHRGRRSVLADADTTYVPPGVRLDFGAVGKAYAADRAAAVALQAGDGSWQAVVTWIREVADTRQRKVVTVSGGSVQQLEAPVAYR